jgi:hypothetical protein
MDWTHPAVVHAVWDEIRTLRGAWRVLVPRDAARTCARIGAVCRALRGDGMHLLQLLQALGRPYLLLHPAFRTILSQTVALELAMRRFVHLLHERAARRGVPVAVAGGYAAWQLERRERAEAGEDAYPRASDEDMCAVWVPEDVDVYLACELPTAEDIIVEPLLRLGMDIGPALRSFSEPYLPVVWRAQCEAQGAYGEEDDRGEPFDDREDVCAFVERAVGFRLPMLSASTRRAVAEQVRDEVRDDGADEAGLVARTWRAGAYAMHDVPMSPQSVHVVHTMPPPPDAGRAGYAAWVAARFDLRHCAISCAVGDDGAWSFAGDEGAREALRDRVLRFQPRAMRTRQDAARTVERLVKYMQRGFQIPAA